MTDRDLAGTVVSLPTLAHNIVMLMGFDAEGDAVIRMALSAGRLSPAVERWMADFIAGPELDVESWSGVGGNGVHEARDCVLVYPSVAPEWVFLVAFDRAGSPQLTVEVAGDRLSGRLERWMLDFVRSETSTPLDRPQP